jgi:hypothetical protein
MYYQFYSNYPHFLCIKKKGYLQCSILKSATSVKCHFGHQRSKFCLFVFWAPHKNVLCKVSTTHSEGLSKNCMSQSTMVAIRK